MLQQVYLAMRRKFNLPQPDRHNSVTFLLGEKIWVLLINIIMAFLLTSFKSKEIMDMLQLNNVYSLNFIECIW